MTIRSLKFNGCAQAMTVSNNYTTLYDLTFNNGAFSIIATGVSGLSIINNTISNAISAYSLSISSSSNITITNSSFHDCLMPANNFSSAVHIIDSQVFISFSSFFNNRITGLLADTTPQGNSSITVNNCTFINNTSPEFGGGIRIGERSTLKVYSSTFIKNTAADCGGGIFSHFNSSILVSNCHFQKNGATLGISLSCFKFSFNSIFSFYLSLLLQSYVINNITGAAIYVYENDAIIENNLIEYNSAQHAGGGLGGYSSSLSIIRTRFFTNYGRCMSPFFTSVFCELLIIRYFFSWWWHVCAQFNRCSGAINLH